MALPFPLMATNATVAITWLDESSKQQAVNLATQLKLAIIDISSCFDSEFSNIKKQLCGQAQFVLLCSEQGLSLLDGNNNSVIKVNFATGSNNHRRLFGGGNGQLIAKAVGIKNNSYPTVLDLTAGFGSDAFVLASLGCKVLMLERQPLIYYLLADGLLRATQAGTELAAIVNRLSLLHQDGITYLQQSTNTVADIIYLDPMYPPRKKTAQVKKPMAALHKLIGNDDDSIRLLNLALASTAKKVLVKRPKTAAPLGELVPSHTVASKNTRYDVYLPKPLTAG